MRLVIGLVFLLAALGAQAQMSSAEAEAMVQRAVDLQAAQAKTHRPMRFELRKMDDKRDTTKVIVETKDGDVARLIAVEGKPLTAEAEAVERARLEDLLEHPEKQAKRMHDEARDRARVDRLMKMLPQAFVYTDAGTVPCAGGECERLSFKPNPAWSAPDFEAGLLKSLAGEMWIDRGQGMMVRLDAHFIDAAEVGLGLVGKIDQGGTVLIERSDTGVGHDWEVTGFKLDLRGRVVFKAMAVKTRQEMSHFQAVPEMDLGAAVKMLEEHTP